MSKLRVLVAVALLPLFAAGCASSGGGAMSNDARCAIIGAAAGAGGGLLLDGEIIGALVGAGAGAVLGSAFCSETQVADADGDGVADGADKCPNTPKGAPVDKKGCPTDRDKDGVPDYKDRCITPLGVKVDENGCAVDSDGDGVSDADDQCPDTPAGIKVDEFGCPGDSDADGVTDDKDQCPNTPFGWQVDGRGCALPVVFRDVNFAFDSAKLSAKARATLEKKAVPLMRSNPGVKVRIVGHTDSVGTEAYNQALSEARAASVATYLFSRGVRKDRMMTEGKGESDPVAPNSVEAGRAANRRVEMFAVK